MLSRFVATCREKGRKDKRYYRDIELDISLLKGTWVLNSGNITVVEFHIDKKMMFYGLVSYRHLDTEEDVANGWKEVLDNL